MYRFSDSEMTLQECCSQHSFCGVFCEVRYRRSFLQPQIIGMWKKWKGTEVTTSQGTVSALIGGRVGEN
jgi:hypothetical protein